MASIDRRPNGTYRARWREHPGGPQRTRHFTRKRDAERFLAAVQNDLARGVYVDPSTGRTTFGEWVEQYLATTPKRATTAARDRSALEHWWLPAFGDVQLGAITPSAIRSVLQKMRDAGRAASSIRTYYAVLKAVMAAAVEADLIGRTPCRGIKLDGERRDEPRFLTIDELQRLAEHMPEQYRPMVYVGGVLGLRWSEIAGLRVKRLDFLRRTLEVAETVAEVEGRIMVADVKTKASRRTLTVPAPIMDMLAEHLARRGRPGPDEFVFTAPKGGPLSATHFRSRVWKPAVQAARLDGFNFHGLRHSAVGFMIELGAHPRVIQKRMGHASIRTTFDVYGSVLPTADEAVSAGLADLLRGSRGADRRAIED
jgi:integrase